MGFSLAHKKEVELSIEYQVANIVLQLKISFSYSKPSVSTEYINFYNNYRIQTKTKLTSLEKRNQFVS